MLSFKEKLKLVPKDFLLYPIAPTLFGVAFTCIFVFGKIIDIYFFTFCILLCAIQFLGYLYVIFDIMYNPENNFRKKLE